MFDKNDLENQAEKQNKQWNDLMKQQKLKVSGRKV